MDSLKTRIRSVQDFPKPGITFFDITTLLRDREGFGATLDAMTKPFSGRWPIA
jgi:adenine phosphoribosyltransferase